MRRPLSRDYEGLGEGWVASFVMFGRHAAPYKQVNTVAGMFLTPDSGAIRKALTAASVEPSKFTATHAF